MKKTINLGYQPLPAARAVSPLDRVERGMAGMSSEVAQQSARAGNLGGLIGRRISAPSTNEPRPRGPRTGPTGKPVAQGQPAVPSRARDRFISLPDELNAAPPAVEETAAGVPTIFEDLAEGDTVGARGRITTYCVSERIDRKELELRLRERDSTAPLHSFPDVLYGRYETTRPTGETLSGDVFYFDYGVIVLWNLSPEDEYAVLRGVSPAFIDPLPPNEIEKDEFAFHYTASEKPHIQNDTFTINYRLAGDHKLKVSISHALAQSTKLSVYEERVMEIVEETKDLPEILATSGQVTMTRKEIAQLIGRVFLQRSAVNLLSTVLDTPEFFWSAPDSMQALYKRCCEYLEYENRVEVLNSRFQVLQEMLDMLRDHNNNAHNVRLEWIVIYLILIEVFIGLLECFSILGWVGK